MPHWSDTIVEALRAHSIRIVPYVPDAVGWQVLSKLDADPAFHTVPCAREEEAIGIAAGAIATGTKAAVFMQSSGFGNTVNALAQLAVASRVGMPLFIGMRGGLGEFNAVQVPAAQAIPGILDELNIQHYAPQREDELAKTVDGALTLATSSRFPVAVLLYSILVGAKRA
ncbi:MAG: thiamine pyrophosphate-binding protein [Chloroflexota bacterium]